MALIYRSLLLMLLFVCLVRPGLAQDRETEISRVNYQLDLLHEMASKGNFESYFELYDEEAIFLGTDATERWSLDEFKAYARPAFDQGSGWTYVSTSRNIFIADDGATAWFDEMLENESLGSTRGTGVLIRRADKWKIVQYNLTLPVPNQLAREFVARIRSLSSGD